MYLPRHLLWYTQDRERDDWVSVKPSLYPALHKATSSAPEPHIKPRILPGMMVDVIQNTAPTIPDAQPRPLPYRAPTWSWASIDTRIEYHPFVLALNANEQSHIQVLHHETSCVPVEAGDPMGAVKSGKLSIEGWIVPVKLITVEWGTQSRPDGYVLSDSWVGRMSIVQAGNGWQEQVCCDLKRPLEIDKGDTWYESNNLNSGWHANLERVSELEYYCLKVATYGGRTDVDGFTFCLVLERSKTVEGAWERIGLSMMQHTVFMVGESSYEDEGDALLMLFNEAKLEKLQIV